MESNKMHKTWQGKNKKGGRQKINKEQGQQIKISYIFGGY